VGNRLVGPSRQQQSHQRIEPEQARDLEQMVSRQELIEYQTEMLDRFNQVQSALDRLTSSITANRVDHDELQVPNHGQKVNQGVGSTYWNQNRQDVSNEDQV
jgi:hypothetical protein